MLRPLKRWYWSVPAVLLFLAVAVVWGARQAAGWSSAPEPVAGTGVYRLRNLAVDVYGGRVGDAVVLIDAGLDARGRGLDRLLARLGRDREHVRFVFVTHGHPDHVGAVHLLPQAEVYVGQEDRPLLRGQFERPHPVQRLMSVLFPVPPAEATHGLFGRLTVPLAGNKEILQAFPFPGHSRGSYLYYWRGVLFTGDAILFRDGALAFPPESFLLDPPLAARSRAQLPALLQGLTIVSVCTGHGGCTPPAETPQLVRDLLAQGSR